MTMNSLEKFVRDNSSLFEEEPPIGHFERMGQKIKRKPAKMATLRWGLSIAASIAILLSVGIVWKYAAKPNETTICENTDDIKFCYLNKMNIVAVQIEALVQGFDQWSREELMNDVLEIINIANGDFESELPDDLPDEIIREILLDYYSHILESLESMANHLEIIMKSES